MNITREYDFRETVLKGYFAGDVSDFDQVDLYRIGSWYAVKMHDHYCVRRVHSGRSYGEHYFGL